MKIKKCFLLKYLIIIFILLFNNNIIFSAAIRSRNYSDDDDTYTVRTQRPADTKTRSLVRAFVTATEDNIGNGSLASDIAALVVAKKIMDMKAIQDISNNQKASKYFKMDKIAEDSAHKIFSSKIK